MTKLSPEDRKALGGIIVGVAWGGLTMAGPLAFPRAPLWIWQASFSLAAIAVLAGIAVLAYDFFIRPKGKRVDPFIATAIIAMFVALVCLGIYVARGPQIADKDASDSGSTPVQPEITLIAPEQRHEVIWNPKKQLFIIYGPEGETREDRWNTPIFRVKNLSNTAVQDATVSWQIEITGIEKLVKSSARLSSFAFDFTGKDRVTISGNSLPTFTYNDIRASQGVPVTFITSGGSDAFIPANVFTSLLMYILALMPDQPGARIDPFTFSVTVSWNIPKPALQKFLVKTTIVNAKPPNVTEPEIDALLSFEVAKVQ